jgi:polyisoprenoid-binding protein YceI
MTTALLALLVAAAPLAGRTYTLDPAQSAVRYHVVHKFHRVTGATSRVEGKAVIQPDGKLLAMVRVPVASFDSGDGNRDAHMQEAVDAGRFPFVVLKGVGRLDGTALEARAGAAGQGDSVPVRLAAQVELHGVTRPIEVPITVELSPDGTARARGSFEVILDAFGIDRPSLLFVKIDDACRIEVDLRLREAKP